MKNSHVDRALRWYPKAWPQRYGDELAALIDDLLSRATLDNKTLINLVLMGLSLRAGAAMTCSASAVRYAAGSCALLALASTLVWIGMTTLTHPAATSIQSRGGVNLAVYMESSATSKEITHMKSSLSQVSGVAHCSYDDKWASYALEKQIFGEQQAQLKVLNPADTPTVFLCRLRDGSKSPSAASRFRNGAGAVLGAYFPLTRSTTIFGSWQP
jgi:hypothetical protein